MPLDPVSLGVMGGTSLVGGLMGRSSARRSAQAQARIAAAIERAQRLQEEMIQKYEGFADPFREELYPNILGLLSGDTDIATNPMYQNARIPLEEQYSQARTALESRPGSTGAVGRSLGRLEAGRAREVGGIPSKLYQMLLGAGFGIASGQPGLAVQGYGDIARTNAPLLDTYQGGIDRGTGMMAGSGELLGETLFNYFNSSAGASSPGAMFSGGVDYGLPSLRTNPRYSGGG